MKLVEHRARKAGKVLGESLAEDLVLRFGDTMCSPENQEVAFETVMRTIELARDAFYVDHPGEMKAALTLADRAHSAFQTRMTTLIDKIDIAEKNGTWPQQN